MTTRHATGHPSGIGEVTSPRPREPVLVRFVGSGDAFGSGGRAQTCISLRSGATHLLVDCGTTSLTAMKTQGVDPGTVTGVVVTHLHGDHFGGLPFLILDAQFTRRTDPLHILGPPGIRGRLSAAMETLFPGSSAVQRRFDVQITEVVPDGSPAPLDVATVRGWQVEHPSGAPALAIRVELHDASFGYSGDTQWTPALVSASAGTQLFAVEAYTYDTPVRYHLDYATVSRHAAELSAERLVLTHMSPRMLARIGDVDHPTAFDGLTMEL